MLKQKQQCANEIRHLTKFETTNEKDNRIITPTSILTE